MNSIRKARGRPRHRSVSFQTFGWVLIREAYMAAVSSPVPTRALSDEWRRFVSSLPSGVVRRRLELFLVRHPERRIV
jgi:hypothetical protein